MFKVGISHITQKGTVCAAITFSYIYIVIDMLQESGLKEQWALFKASCIASVGTYPLNTPLEWAALTLDSSTTPSVFENVDTQPSIHPSTHSPTIRQMMW